MTTMDRNYLFDTKLPSTTNPDVFVTIVACKVEQISPLRHGVTLVLPCVMPANETIIPLLQLISDSAMKFTCVLQQLHFKQSNCDDKTNCIYTKVFGST